jgi:hypothetical protein
VYKPVYEDPEIALNLTVGPPKPISNPANIIIYNDLLMVNIKGEGFHVIDNRNPSLPIPLFFVNVPGNQNVSIKEGVLYADNYSDIVAFRITTDLQLEVLDRLENVMNNQEYPPFRDVYFECVDPERGVVIDWILSDNSNAECYR